MMCSCLLFTALVSCVASYQIYQQQIPNGDSVPHPCRPNALWLAIGHHDDQAGGERDPFGQDFEKQGKIWTQELCHLDSDGDGLTNGQELGDPDCVWTPNSIPSRRLGLTNPGICDPWDSPSCFANNITSIKYHNQEEWMRDVCKPGLFSCPGMNDTDTHQVNMTLANGTQIPFMEKSYYCQVFDLQSRLVGNGSYHVIALEPILDNLAAVHHIAIFGCEDVQPESPAPFDCSVFPSISCETIISMWTIGRAGDCFHSDTGITVGRDGYKRMALQVFWNNPAQREDWLDSSGLRLYYTSKKRPYELGTMKVGHESFLVPPYQAAVSFVSTCTRECTLKMLNASVMVTMAWNHMHYIGKKMEIQVVRNVTAKDYLTYDTTYNYDSPQIQYFNDHPFHIDPGDEIVTTCTYATADQTWTTTWGTYETQEMCYGFLRYFPKENAQVSSCTTVGPDINYCDSSTFHNCTDLLKFSDPFFLSVANFYQDVLHNCHSFSPCLGECTEIIVNLKKTDPCFQDEVFDFLKDQMLNSNPVGQGFMARLASCQRQVDAVMFNVTLSK